MSWSKDITIWCDVERCAPEWFMADALGPKTLGAARRQAQRQGWAYRDGKDFCPDHASVALVEGTQGGTE